MVLDCVCPEIETFFPCLLYGGKHAIYSPTSWSSFKGGIESSLKSHMWNPKFVYQAEGEHTGSRLRWLSGCPRVEMLGGTAPLPGSRAASGSASPGAAMEVACGEESRGGDSHLGVLLMASCCRAVTQPPATPCKRM